MHLPSAPTEASSSGVFPIDDHHGCRPSPVGLVDLAGFSVGQGLELLTFHTVIPVAVELELLDVFLIEWVSFASHYPSG